MSFPYLSKELYRQRLMPKTGKMRVVIDTDAKNEVDDQFAIAWALRSPERLQVEAIYAAPFSQRCFQRENESGLNETSGSLVNMADSPREGMEASYQEILHLLSLLRLNKEPPVYRGSTEYMLDVGGPVDSDAARDLINRAMASEEPLYVMAIGAATNVASAIEMCPEIISKIVVVWLGGQPVEFGQCIEFNLMQDVPAARCLFESGVPLVWIPCMTVASLLSVSGEELEKRLLGKSEIGTYLSNIVLENFHGDGPADIMAKMQRTFYLKDQDDYPDGMVNQFHSDHLAWSRIIWDISTAGYLINPLWTPSKLIPAPIILDGLRWQKGKDDRHPIRAVRYVLRDLIFGDMFYKLAK